MKPRPRGRSKQPPGATWITRVNAGLKLRAEGEQQIAAALAERKKQVGTAQWLKDCAAEWGWSESTAYRHLDPKQMERARAHTCQQRDAAKELPTVGSGPGPWPVATPCSECHASVDTFVIGQLAGHAPGCSQRPPDPSPSSPPMPIQRELIEQAHRNEAVDAAPLVMPEHEPDEMGEGWILAAVVGFESACAYLAENDRVLRRLGTEGRVRVRTAAQRVLDALDPKAAE